MNYPSGATATVSAKVRYYDLSDGIAARVQAIYDFIQQGGYAPVGAVGVPCTDVAKGKLTVSFLSIGLNPQVPVMTVRDGPTLGDISASDVPLNVYAADGTEPWLQYTLPAGRYAGRTVFQRTDWPPEVVDSWEEGWS